jgi:hypothetical protein
MSEIDPSNETAAIAMFVVAMVLGATITCCAWALHRRRERYLTSVRLRRLDEVTYGAAGSGV